MQFEVFLNSNYFKYLKRNCCQESYITHIQFMAKKRNMYIYTCNVHLIRAHLSYSCTYTIFFNVH